MQLSSTRINVFLLQRQWLYFLLLLSLCLSSCNNQKRYYSAAKRTVEVIEQDGKYQLYRHGSPYFVKGAGGYEHLNELQKAGGNSIRTWNTDNAKAILDSAYRHGLTVTLGLKVNYAVTEMDYSSKKAIAEQRERIRKEVLRYKDHPALLMWGIGNEPTLHLSPGSNPTDIIEHTRVWLAIDDIAGMVHELDPNHPTTTMLQNAPKLTTFFISYFCDNIDVLSFNVFLTHKRNFDETIRSYGWIGPYLISEFGNYGYWQEKSGSEWHAIPEKSSTEKAKMVQQFYQRNISANSNCLGAYAFYWGHKQEFTSTWFSLFTEFGEATEVVDALHYLWTGNQATYKSPSIYSIKINNKERSVYLKPDSNYIITVEASSSVIDNLEMRWEIMKDDIEVYTEAQYNQTKPDIIQRGTLPLANSVTLSAQSKVFDYAVSFVAPREEGPYRFFLYLRNKHNKVATANTSFFVLPEM